MDVNMKAIIILLVVVMFSTIQGKEKMEFNKLTAEEERVIVDKGTERPFTGKFNKHYENGTYTCKRCDAVLYESSTKFDSGCGWPSFDDEVDGAVKHVPDADGMRTEIICTNCDAHLGHVFKGEKFTEKNTRHCVNSISLNFVPVQAEAIFAGGCFWGVEALFSKLDGVSEVVSGYIGGKTENPNYLEVCNGTGGHAEAVRIFYNPEVISYEELAKHFFEIHDFTQVNRQGPDIGEQYRTAIFYKNEEEKETANKIIKLLFGMGYDVATTVEQADKFWEAEDYHQDYYARTSKTPYCHIHKKIFE
jgi:peptide methionine sulfoxide reductase msrA/msrB